MEEHVEDKYHILIRVIFVNGTENLYFYQKITNAEKSKKDDRTKGSLSNNL